MTLTKGHISKVKVTVHTYPKILVRAITPHCQVGSVKYFTHILSMTEECVITLTQRHISEVKVTVHTYPKSMSGQYLLFAKLGLDNISHNCCPGPKGVSWPWPKVISPRSWSQCTHNPNRVRVITAKWDLDHMSRNRIMTLTLGHIAKVTVYTWQNIFPDHYLSCVPKMGMILHTIVVHDPGVVVAGVFVPLGNV